MTVILIVLLALFLLALVAAPLFSDRLADPLPDLRDPVTVDLEEERDALLRAIHELDAREDLTGPRREELRRRYEAKAARVLRLLDERASEQAGKPRRAAAKQDARRMPWGGAVLALVCIGIAAGLGSWVLPRTGQASVTAFFEGDIELARQLQALQQAVASDPNAPNLLALGDAYWELGDADGALRTYQQAADGLDPAPAMALKRLGLLTLSEDPESALGLLSRSAAADPTDPETLFYLAELQLMFGEFEASRATWQQFDSLGTGDDRGALRLALLDELIPLYREMEEDPNAEALAAIGNAWWNVGEQELAVDAYFGILTRFDPLHTEALSRTGQVLFTSGRVEDAVAFLERAVLDGTPDTDAMLFLGNGRYSLGEYEAAIAAWTMYVEAVGPEAAGRVPGLIEDAQARLRGEQPAQVEPALAGQQVTAEVLYMRHCAECHGSNAAGGTGPALAGSARSADAAMVENTIRFGRGAMPGFMATLSGEEIALLVDYVAVELAGR